MNETSARFGSLLESAIFVVVFVAIYWTLGFLIKKLFNKEIRNSTGYTICIVGGFLAKRFLITILQ
jgi:positive regulator of sigma E activity